MSLFVFALRSLIDASALNLFGIIKKIKMMGFITLYIRTADNGKVRGNLCQIFNETKF